MFVNVCVFVLIALCVVRGLACHVVWFVVCAWLCVFVYFYPKRTCSVGCTIEESKDRGNTYDIWETTTWGRNLGAMFF